ncbi:hypothetical protein Bbelb_251040 [Branchiostoma belcheri]|nr:hypothetical protein Bbelb_251040 [Branchiostoma belcheri]
MPFQDKSGLKAHTLRKHPEVVFNTAPGSELSPENYKTLSHINTQLNNLHGTEETDFTVNDDDEIQESAEQQESLDSDSLQASSLSLLQSATETQEKGLTEKERVEDNIQDGSTDQPDLRENIQVDKITVNRNGPLRKASDTAYWPKRKKGVKKLARVAAVLLNGVPREGIPKGSIPVFRKGRLSLVRADDLKPNACSICGKRFWYKYDLRRHMTMHSDFRPHKCKFCKYRSRQMNQLKIHMQRHKGVFRPFRCPACDFSSSTKPEMKAHVARHLTVWTNHICPFCYYGFRTNEELIEHQSTKHGSVEGSASSSVGLAPGNSHLSVPQSFQQGNPTLIGMVRQSTSMVPSIAGMPWENPALLGGGALPTNHTDNTSEEEGVEDLSRSNGNDVGSIQSGLVIQDVRSLQPTEGDSKSTEVFRSLEERATEQDLAKDVLPKSESAIDDVQAKVQVSDQTFVKESSVRQGAVQSKRADTSVVSPLTQDSDTYTVQYGKRKLTSTENEWPSAKAARSEGTVQNSGATIAVLRPTDELILCNTFGHSRKQDVELSPGQQLEFWVKKNTVAAPQCNGDVAEKATEISKCNGAVEVRQERTDSDNADSIDVDYDDRVETRVITKIEKVEMKCKAYKINPQDRDKWRAAIKPQLYSASTSNPWEMGNNRR